MELNLPSILNISTDDLNNKFRHRVALVKGGKIVGFGESSLAGCRYLQSNFGKSCHAEINAFKKLSYKLQYDPRKVAKNNFI